MYQGPALIFITTVLDELLHGFLCGTSTTLQVVSGLIEILNIVSTVFSLTGLLLFYRRLSAELRPHHVVGRFAALKGMVFLIIHQAFIIEILQLIKVVTPTEYMSLGGESDFCSTP